MTRLLLLIFLAAASLTTAAQVWAGTDIYVTHIHGIDANGDSTGYVHIDCIVLPGGDTICGGIDSISLNGNTFCLYRDSAAPLCVTLSGLSDTPTLAQVLAKGNTANGSIGIDTVQFDNHFLTEEPGEGLIIWDNDITGSIGLQPQQGHIDFTAPGSSTGQLNAANLTSNRVWRLPDSTGTIALREYLYLASSFADSTLIFTNGDSIATSDSNFFWTNQSKRALRIGGSPYLMNIPFGTDIYTLGVMRDSGTSDKTAEFVDFGTNVIHFRSWNGSRNFPRAKNQGEVFSSWGFQPAATTANGVRTPGSSGAMQWRMRDTATDTKMGSQFELGVTPKGIGDNGRLNKMILQSERAYFLTQNDSLDRGLVEQQFSSTAYGARIMGEKHRGTIAGPTTIVTGDTIAQFGARAYTGSAYIRAGWAGWRSNGTISATRAPTEYIIATATDATPSVETEALRITNAQNVGIGTAIPTGKLHVVNNNNSFTGFRLESTTASSPTSGATFFSIQNDGTVMTAGERLFGYGAFGARGGGNGVGVRIDCFADDTWNPGSTPGYVTFSTTPTGTASTVEAMRITSAQVLQVGANNNIAGAANSSDAAIGNVGEEISHNIGFGSSVSLTDATTATVDSLTLTPGDWDVTGTVRFALSGATTSDFQAGFSFSKNVLGADSMTIQSPFVFTTLSSVYAPTLPTTRVSINSTTKVFFVAQTTFSAGTVSAYGHIRARRVR